MKKIFLLLNILIGLLGHLTMFFIWRYFLDIGGILGQAIIAEVLLVAVFLVVLAPFLIHYRDNYLHRALYLATNLWIGFMVNTALVALIAILLKSIFNVLGAPLDLPHIFHGLYILLIPVIMMPFEISNALGHKIKKVTIEIKDLPREWEGKEVVHLTDMHLGPIYRLGTFIRVMKKVNTLKPSAIFITGDLFDGMEADFSWLKNPYHHVHAPKGVYYSFGNHDLAMGKQKVIDLLKDSPIEVLDDKTKLVDDLQIVGVTCLFDRRMNFKESIYNQAGYDKNKPSILLFHEPRYINEAREVGIDLQLSGHTHNGQLFPGNILAQILYRGYAYGVHRKKDGYNLIVSAGTGTWGPPMRIGHRSEILLIKLKRKRDEYTKDTYNSTQRA